MKKYQVQVNKRFCGPPSSVNGGYCAGLLAKKLGRSAKVRLHAPPPLEVPLDIVHKGELVELKHGDTLLATGSDCYFELSVPPVPSLETAKEAQTRYAAYEGHVFPCCFVCGPDRKVGDGLRIFPGPIVADDWSVLACEWNPSPDLIGEDSYIREEFIWAALDCPSYFSVVGKSLKLALLGEFELSILSDVPGDTPLIIWSWPISENGRKLIGGSALATPDGELVAYAKGTWIELKQ